MFTWLHEQQKMSLAGRNWRTDVTSVRRSKRIASKNGSTRLSLIVCRFNKNIEELAAFTFWIWRGACSEIASCSMEFTLAGHGAVRRHSQAGYYTEWWNLLSGLQRKQKSFHDCKNENSNLRRVKRRCGVEVKVKFRAAICCTLVGIDP